MIYQELETYYLLPAIRRELVKLMVKKGVLPYVIAKKLHLTKSAVSQYLSGKRSSEFKLDSKFIVPCSEGILAGHDSSMEIQKLISSLKADMKICDIYKQNNLVPDDCRFCKEKGESQGKLSDNGVKGGKNELKN